jgi:hypothetical protein
MKKYHSTNLLYQSDIVNKKNSQQVEYRQLALPLQVPFAKRQKPQITSVPGISVKVRDRYRLVLGDKILRDRLTLDEALAVAKRGEG